MKINIGGGLKRIDGFVNVDADPNTKPEYLHNLETDKLPFEDSTVEEVKAHHILEHIHNLGHVIKEIYRVCKNGAVVDIAFPHHFSRNFFGDYTHCRALTVEMFKQFSKKYCLWHQETYGSSSGHAITHNVNLEILDYMYSIHADYAQLEAEGKYEEIGRLAEHLVNVYQDVFIKLIVIKE